MPNDGVSDWGGYMQRSQSAYGSSIEFERWLRANRPDLVVPESECVLMDSPGWTPENEAPPGMGETCRRCGGVEDEDTRLVCPRCMLSGFESQLAEQRRLAGVPAADPKPRAGRGGLG